MLDISSSKSSNNQSNPGSEFQNNLRSNKSDRDRKEISKENYLKLITIIKPNNNSIEENNSNLSLLINFQENSSLNEDSTRNFTNKFGNQSNNDSIKNSNISSISHQTKNLSLNEN